MNIIQTKEGWSVIVGDLISGWVIESKQLDHDAFLPPLACLNFEPGGVVIDVGANIGSHSVAYARKLGKEGTLICIESNHVALECLNKNAEKFECQTLVIHAVATNVHGGHALHSIICEPTNVGMSTVGETGPIETEVRTITIDGLFQDCGAKRLDFMKIDVEGFELKVLLGARETINKCKPKMLIEMNEVALVAQGSNYKEVYDLLLSLNYSWQICEPQSKGGDAVYNILCWPNAIEVVKSLNGHSPL